MRNSFNTHASFETWTVGARLSPVGREALTSLLSNGPEQERRIHASNADDQPEVAIHQHGSDEARAHV